MAQLIFTVELLQQQNVNCAGDTSSQLVGTAAETIIFE